MTVMESRYMARGTGGGPEEAYDQLRTNRGQ